MTEYEMAALFQSMEATRAANASVILTMISGFLVASYVFSHRLKRPSMTLFLALYTFFFLAVWGPSIRHMANMGGLAAKIQSIALRDQGFDWTSYKAFPISPNFFLQPEFIFITGGVTAMLVYSASIAFFFTMRRQSLAAIKAEAAAKATPPAPEPGKSPLDSASL